MEIKFKSINKTKVTFEITMSVEDFRLLLDKTIKASKKANA